MHLHTICFLWSNLLVMNLRVLTVIADILDWPNNDTVVNIGIVQRRYRTA